MADFADTNVLVYALSSDPKSVRAEELLRAGCATSVQALNEFANVARRKLGMTWSEVEEALSILRSLVDPIAPVDIDTHSQALELCTRYGFSMYDGLIVASALRLGCRRLWSEDFHHGLVVEGSLTIENPF